MKKIYVLVVLFIGSIQLCIAQQWAGPDTVSCGDKGVMIGSSDPCPDCCYVWTPKEGLDNPNAKNPIARPKHETTYKVVVTDANLSWKKTDEVKVGLSFGEIHFVPDHLVQGTEEIVLAKLVNNDENFSTTWSFEGDDLGCTLEPNSNDENKATLTPGSEYGKLLVRVSNQSDTACYFTDTLPVNSGVKDLRVIDLNNPNRIANTGETLYLISNDPVEWKANLIAIPNEGGFANGIPDYKQDTYLTPLPIDGEDNQIVEDVATVVGKQSDYIAGETFNDPPYVSIVRKIPVESTSGLPALAQNLVNFWQDLEESLNFDDVDFNAPGGPPTNACPDTSPFTFEGNFGVVMKETEVEKYGDPSMGIKEDCSIDLGVNIAGRIFHPQFTRHFVVAGVGVCSEVYAELGLVATLHLSMTADESLENSDWMLNSPQIEIGVSGAVGFNAVLLSGTGFNLQASGSAAVSLKGFLDFNVAARKIVASSKLLPVTLKLEAVIVNENNMGEFEPLFNLLSKEVVIYKGFTSNPLTLYQFNE